MHMRHLLFYLGAVFGFSSSLLYSVAQDSFHDGKQNRDFEAVQNYVNSKRTMTLGEKTPHLKIYGDLRSEVYYRYEKRQGVHVRGSGAVDRNDVPIPRVTSEVEFNLWTKYDCGNRSWVATRLNFSGDSGIHPSRFDCAEAPHGLYGSGGNKLALKDLVIGYELWKRGDSDRVTIQAGRASMYQIFEVVSQCKL